MAMQSIKKMEARSHSWRENWVLASKNESWSEFGHNGIGSGRQNQGFSARKYYVHPSMAPHSAQSHDLYSLQPTQSRNRLPRTPQQSNRCCTNCQKTTVNVLQRRWVYLLQGVVIFILGLVLGIIYFCIRAVTATLQHTETIPSYIPSILLMMSGILAGLLFWKRENLLVIGALFLCLASTIICVACSVFLLTQHIPLIKRMVLCSFDKMARQCHCYSDSFKDQTLYTFYEIANCDLLHTDLLDYHYTQCGLYLVTGLICFIAATFHVLLLRFHNGRKLDSASSGQTRSVSVPQPVDVEHLANIQLLRRSHMTGLNQSDLLHENHGERFDNHGYDATTGIEVFPPTGNQEPLVCIPADIERSHGPHHDPFSRFISLPGEPRVCLLGIRKRESILQPAPEVRQNADAAEHIDDLPVGASAQDLAQGQGRVGTGQRSLPIRGGDQLILNGRELHCYQNRRNSLADVRNDLPRHPRPSYSPSVAHSDRPSATTPHRPMRRCRCHDLPRRPLPRQPINSLPPRPITRSRNLETCLPRVPLRRGYPFAQTVSPQLQDYLEQCSRFSHASDLMPQRHPARCARLGHLHAPRTRSCCSDDYLAFHYLPEFLALPEEPPPPYSLSPPYDNEHLPDYSSGRSTVRNAGHVTRTGLRRVLMPETEL